MSILLEDSEVNAEAYYHRGLLYSKLEMPKLAVCDLVAACTLNRAMIKAHLNLGLIYMRTLHEGDKALQCFNNAIEQDPTNLRAYMYRGEYYEGLITQASKQAALVSEKSEQHTRAIWNKKNNIATQCSVYAIREYSRAIHLYPTKYLLYLHRGSLLMKLGSMAEATTDFHAAFDLNASIAQTFIQRVLILSFQRKYAQIIQEFEGRKSTQRTDDPALLMLVAKARIRCGDHRGALNELNSVLELGIKNDPQIYLQRGICYENLEEWASASAEFSQCIALIPSYSKAYYHRGICKLYTGDKSGVEDLHLAIQCDPRFFDAYLTRANYYHSDGQYAVAIEDCNMALELEPTSVSAFLLRGACKCKLNHYARAIVDFTNASNIDKVFQLT
jgi:tetratricopeptide (TPR) repeat protein